MHFVFEVSFLYVFLRRRITLTVIFIRLTNHIFNCCWSILIFLFNTFRFYYFRYKWLGWEYVELFYIKSCYLLRENDFFFREVCRLLIGLCKNDSCFCSSTVRINTSEFLNLRMPAFDAWSRAQLLICANYFMASNRATKFGHII